MKTEPSPDGVIRYLEIMGGKWKPAILFSIHQGTNRFGALRSMIPGITKQMLTQQLRALEQDKVIDREIFPEIPPRVEYSLTKYGKTLLPVVHAMQEWGENDLAAPEESDENRDQFMLPL